MILTSLRGSKAASQHSPFFTFLEDFPNLFLGNIIFVRDLKERKKNNITRFYVHDLTKYIHTVVQTLSFLFLTYAHTKTLMRTCLSWGRGATCLWRELESGVLLPKVTGVTALLYGHGFLKLIPYRAVLDLQRKYRAALSTQHPCTALVLSDERMLLQQEN